MTTTSMNRGNGTVSRILEWFWDFIDVTDNLQKLGYEMKKVSNGLDSLWFAFGYGVISIVLLALTWYFDLEATLVGMESLRGAIIPTLPEQVLQMTWLLTTAFTIAPMLAETFLAGLARAQIKVIQMMVLGFTLFDVVTDIPRAKSFVDGWSAQFDLLPFGVSFFTYWIVFFVWLLAATVGFQIAAVITTFGAIGYVKKIFSDSNGNSTFKK